MSKSGELRIIRFGRSIDAPVNYHHRTGDSEGNGGSMLDLYAHSESVEEICLNDEDELAKTMFLKGFKGYLKKVFSFQEREFLRRLMSGKEKPQEVGRALGVDWFKYMQSIQRKAYKNTKPLLKLSTLTGWSRAEEFTVGIMRRLSLLDDGADLSEILPHTAQRAKVRAALKTAREANATEKAIEYANVKALYRANNVEKIRNLKKEHYKKFKAEIKAQRKAYREAHIEEVRAARRARDKAYYERKREEKKAKTAAYRAENREKCLETSRRCREKKKAQYLECARRWRKNNPGYQKQYRERKKAEREAAKAIAAT